MRKSGAGFNLWTLMAAVAIAAVTLAAARTENAPSAGIAIVLACISSLAYKKYSEAISLRQASGLTTSPLQKSGTLLTSGIVAAVVIGLSDIAFLTGYYGYLRGADKIIVASHMTPSVTPRFMVIGSIIGITLALCVASTLRRAVYMNDRPKSRHPRQWLKLWWPVGLTIVIGVLSFADYMWERYSFCRMMAEYHGGPKAKAVGLGNPALHAWLKQWYERAAIRPWLPVHPDRVPPGLE